MSLNIGVFCGSQLGRNRKHLLLTKDVANWIGRKNYNIIFGASDIGLMKTLSKEAFKYNIKILGIIPDFLLKNFETPKFVTDLIVTKTLEQRKKHFITRSDCFIALPGGIGTLNEILDIMVKNELKEINKKIFLINDNDYWKPFIKILNHFIEQKFLEKKVFTSTINIMSLDNIKKEISKINEKN